MAFWNRRRRGRSVQGAGPAIRDDQVDGTIFGGPGGSSPLRYQPRDDPSKQRIYDDEVDPDWEDPITAEDPDDFYDD